MKKIVVFSLCAVFLSSLGQSASAAEYYRSQELVEGDILLPRGAELAWALRLDRAQNSDSRTTGLIVNTLKDNVIDIWSP
ncbi:MAG: hypothetical protein ABIR96_01695, partial [Bdellovibrionota bacterium]